MSHHQDLDIALWAEQEDVLGELLHELRSSAAVLTQITDTDEAAAC